MNNLAPIVLFTYNRYDHTKQCLEALAQNNLAKNSNIYIFSDGPKNENNISKVKEVRDYLNSFDKTKFKKFEIIESSVNKGLANSVIDGVTKILNQYGKIIVLEDDLVTSKNFLNYMNDSLNYYQNNSKIWSISGFNIPINIPKDYNKDVYLSYRGCSWGWATWKDRWDNIDWNIEDYNEFKSNMSQRRKFNRGGNDMARMLDQQMNGKIHSWAIRWCYNQFKQEKYTIYPCHSFVRNIGNDGSGTNCEKSNKYDSIVLNENDYKLENVSINKEIAKNFKANYKIGTKAKIKEILYTLGLNKKI